METTKDQEGGGLLNQILPPRLEDAGLEDCALPPDSINEAFLRAATAVKSRASSIFATDVDEEDEGNCVNDPWPTAGANDTLVGLSPEHEDEADSGPCAKEKGSGVLEERGDDVAVVGGGGGGGGVGVRDGGVKACVEGLQGLKIGEKVKNGGNDEKEVLCRTNLCGFWIPREGSLLNQPIRKLLLMSQVPTPLKVYGGSCGRQDCRRESKCYSGG